MSRTEARIEEAIRSMTRLHVMGVSVKPDDNILPFETIQNVLLRNWKGAHAIDF